MNTKLYVDNLPAVFTENDLMDLFSSYGNIAEVYLRVNQGGGQSRTFGCISMATSEGARLAFHALNGKSIGTFTLTVSELRPGGHFHPGRPTPKLTPQCKLPLLKESL